MLCISFLSISLPLSRLLCSLFLLIGWLAKSIHGTYYAQHNLWRWCAPSIVLFSVNLDDFSLVIANVLHLVNWIKCKELNLKQKQINWWNSINIARWTATAFENKIETSKSCCRLIVFFCNAFSRLIFWIHIATLDLRFDVLCTHGKNLMISCVNCVLLELFYFRTNGEFNVAKMTQAA